MTRRAQYRKATTAETATYATTRTVDGGHPLYPLCGFVMLDGRECPVEFLGRSWCKEDPQYEVLAPVGYHFKHEGIHSMLGESLRDIRDRVFGEALAACSADNPNCEWNGSPAAQDDTNQTGA